MFNFVTVHLDFAKCFCLFYTVLLVKHKFWQQNYKNKNILYHMYLRKILRTKKSKSIITINIIIISTLQILNSFNSFCNFKT